MLPGFLQRDQDDFAPVFRPKALVRQLNFPKLDRLNRLDAVISNKLDIHAPLLRPIQQNETELRLLLTYGL
jgi:hypothetical protein